MFCKTGIEASRISTHHFTGASNTYHVSFWVITSTRADDPSLLYVFGRLFFGIPLPTSAGAALCNRTESEGF